MSAFFVGNQQISKLAYALETRGADLNREAWGKLPRSTKTLAQNLYDMNAKALAERYGKADDMMTPFEFEDGLIYENDAQFYKSFSCYLYQCAEGDVYESEQYALIRKLCDGLAHNIAMQFASAKGARWE